MGAQLKLRSFFLLYMELVNVIVHIKCLDTWPTVGKGLEPGFKNM